MLNDVKSAIKAKGYSIVTIYDPNEEYIEIQLHKYREISYKIFEESEEKCSEALIKFLRILEK